MAYYLGIDLGTTYTAAAVWRDGRVEIASLGTRAPVIPSVVLLRDDGTILTGEAAERRAFTEPQRVAREFKRRVGDSTPLIVGGTPYSADALMARLLRWVVNAVSEREGEPPARVVVSHPANWGPYKQDLLRQAIRIADLEDVATITEPEAAAIHYASQERVDPGSVVAVYDLGGGTFDAAVLRRTQGGWEILGEPEGVERLGGVDFDQAVFHHVQQVVGDAIEHLDADDASAMAALARLRRECVEAKEALASDVDVVIPVLLPNLQTEVRLTRAEFEAMIRPTLADSIGALRRALRSAGVEPADVSAVLLVGGSSRIPLVAQMVGSELGRPVAVDAHPKHGVALGAAIIAAEQGTGRAVDTEVVPTVEPGIATAAVPLVMAATAAASDPAGAAPTERGPIPAASGASVFPGAPGGADVAASESAPAPHAGMPAPVTAPSTPAAPAAPPSPSPSSPVPPSPSPSPSPSSMASEPPLGPTAVSPRAAAAPTSRAPAAAPAGGRPFSGPPGGARGKVTAPSGGDDGGRRTMLLVAVALVAVLAIGGAVLTQRGGNGDDQAGAGEGGAGDTELGQGSGTTAPQQVTDPTTATSEIGTTGTEARISIDAITIEDGYYRVDYTIDGYEPDPSNPPEALHTHFFLDTTTPEAAGTNGDPPGDWHLSYESGSFLTKYGPDNSGGATQMCAVVADSVHGVVDPYSGNCVPLPE